MTGRPRVAVVGHVEWVMHVRGRLPAPGRISHHPGVLDEVGGGGAVAAVQVARLGARCLFLTAVGDDILGSRVVADLRALGVEIRAARRPVPHTRALSAAAPDGDRAIAVLGTPLHPQVEDDLGWDDLADCDAVYVTGRDPATLRPARRAPVLVLAARRWRLLAELPNVRPDVIVGSAHDPDEVVDHTRVPAPAAAEIWTEGAAGGRWSAGGTHGRWTAASPPGPDVDSYGCGDCFAAGVTVGLARGYTLPGAIALGARCGAAVLTGRGGLSAQRREEC